MSKNNSHSSLMKSWKLRQREKKNSSPRSWTNVKQEECLFLKNRCWKRASSHDRGCANVSPFNLSSVAIRELHLHHSLPDLRHHLAVVKTLQQPESVASSCR